MFTSTTDNNCIALCYYSVVSKYITYLANFHQIHP
jgi:hypothetical protein